MTQDRVDRLLEKLETLRACDPDRLVFGASTHGYTLAEPIGADALLAFEAKAGVRLPEEYRAWLLQAGNGGAGPEYGLLPLAGYVSEGFEPHSEPSSVARPFSLAGRWSPSEPVPPLPPGANPYDGTVQLNEIGCGYVHLLVVHGERAGEVWWNYTAGDGELGPSGRSFFGWMEGWLDRSLVDAALREIRAAVEDDRPRRDLLLATEPSFVAELERTPGHAYPHASLGWLRLYQGRLDEARASFAAAEEADPDDVQGSIGRCAASRLAGDPADVLEAVTRARARSPRYVGYLRALLREEALAWWALGDPGRALEVNAALVREMPFVDLPHLDRAYFQWSAGDAEGADATLVAAATAQPFLMLNEPGGALRYPNGTPVTERLAILRAALGERTRCG